MLQKGYRMENKTALDRLLAVITRPKVYIQTHNYPDQDALASAYGLQELLRYKGVESTICYQGEIDKANTVTMMEALGISLYDVDDLPICAEDEIILVDGQKGNVNLEELTGDEIACIDHHPMQDTDSYRFFDIRKVGACATLIAEYFMENNIPVSKNVATALTYGIKMDTSNLMRQTTDADVDMFCVMYKKADIDMIRLFESHSLILTDLDAYREALKDLKIYGHNVGTANVGAGCSEAMMGTVSDFIMSLDVVDFSVVYSFRAGGLKLSVRSELSKADAGVIVRKALTGYPGGGGGHAGMAGGFVAGLDENQAKEAEYVITERIINLVAECLKQ